MKPGEPTLVLDRIPGGIAFWIHVTPRAKRPKVGGLHGDALRVAVAEAPVEGRANAACCLALAHALGCKRREVEIEPGAKSRRKRVRIAAPADLLESKLLALAKPPSLG